MDAKIALGFESVGKRSFMILTYKLSLLQFPLEEVSNAVRACSYSKVSYL